MSYMFQPQSCPFFLFNPFSQIINDQLQNLPFDPINGVRLSFRCCTDECNQSLTVEIDSAGSIAKVKVINPETNSAEMIFDFSRNVFNHYGESLDLICGHPLFHMLQQIFVAHYQNGGYSVTITTL